MPKSRLIAALAALALFVGMAVTPLETWCQVGVAEPNSLHQILQGVPVSLINRPDTTARLWSGDANGNGSVVEQFPAMDQNLTFASIISNASLALGAADSSAILDTHRMRLGMLLFKCSNGTTTGTGDTTVAFRVAYQIRTHLNGSSDSSSVFPIYLYGRSDVGAVTTSAGQTDTTSQGQLMTGTPTTALNATPDANTPWSGEYTLVIQAKRFAHGSSIAVNGHTYYYPNGIAIPLSSIFGRDIYSPYTSVRVRVMTVEKANAAFATEGLAITVSLVGTPL
jgi:hypothetical protein